MFVKIRPVKVENSKVVPDGETLWLRASDVGAVYPNFSEGVCKVALGEHPHDIHDQMGFALEMSAQDFVAAVTKALSGTCVDCCTAPEAEKAPETKPAA